MSMGIDQARAIMTDAARDTDDARARIGGVVSALSEARTKLQAVAGAGFSLAQVVQALGAIEGAMKDLEQAGSKAGIAGQRTRAGISGGL